MPVLEQIRRLIVLLVPLLIITLIEFLLRDHQRPQPLSGQVVALVLNVPAVNRFAFLDHYHVCALEVQDYAACLQVLYDDAHSLGFGGEREVCQDFVLLFCVVRVENENLVLLPVPHQEAKFFSEFYQGDLVRT